MGKAGLIVILSGLAGLCCVMAISPPEQMVLSIASNWNSHTGNLQFFERSAGKWVAASPAISVLYGKSGLAWGRGLRGTGEPGPQKVERDKRAPAGVFEIGKVYTFDQALPEGAVYPFHVVTKQCAWIDDPTHPDYNRHVEVDANNPPAWFEKQKMKHNDPAHRWLIEIRHNADPPVSGAGSAIFFHNRRGPNRASAGCTVMAEENMVRMLRWLRAEARPQYVLLTKDEYLQRWKSWGLPSPAAAAALLATAN